MIKQGIFVVKSYNSYWQYFEYCSICGMLAPLYVPKYNYL
jgi:hypothetical protein